MINKPHQCKVHKIWTFFIWGLKYSDASHSRTIHMKWLVYYLIQTGLYQNNVRCIKHQHQIYSQKENDNLLQFNLNLCIYCIFICMYTLFSCVSFGWCGGWYMYVLVWVPVKARRRHQIPCTWNYRQLWDILIALWYSWNCPIKLCLESGWSQWLANCSWP